MNCPHCGARVVCGTCGIFIEAVPPAEVALLEEMAAGRASQATPPAGDHQTFLVVAKGHQDLLRQLQSVVGDFGWVRIIEDRRSDTTLLPRTGREGTVRTDIAIRIEITGTETEQPP